MLLVRKDLPGVGLGQADNSRLIATPLLAADQHVQNNTHAAVVVDLQLLLPSHADVVNLQMRLASMQARALCMYNTAPAQADNHTLC